MNAMAQKSSSRDDHSTASGVGALDSLNHLDRC
jgi:hypothetical protein